MGEVITCLGRLNLNDVEMEIELNEGVNTSDLIVHFQTEKFRLEMPEKDFISFSLSSIAALRRLRDVKKI